MLLSVRNINKWFGKVHALKNFDLDVRRGEIIGLLGDNGAGKSTFIKIISGLIQPDTGEIYWEGRRVKIRSVQDSRKLGIETVFQERGLIECFPISKNIFLGREPVKFRFFMNLGEMNAKAEELLKQLGMSVSPEQEVRFCSGGEKQGVIVARAMYFRAKLVNLDEPTRALSVKGVRQVLEFVRRLKENNISCIFVTHNMYHVYPVADRFVFLHRGEKILEIERNKVSSPEELNDIIVSRIAE
ncbi:MAG TPA: sugar ABC transporter ATP-binding protein [Candidatus Bathyarchaeota archaeon]|nr:sugar ABC transporter ATP-binding protein [Candidatus Bathyarchaeota archaeon]